MSSFHCHAPAKFCKTGVSHGPPRNRRQIWNNFEDWYEWKLRQAAELRNQENTRASEVTVTFREKTKTIFSELAGERASRLTINGSQGIIAEALKDEIGLEVADDIGFHLSDWAENAAFLVALHLFPERFTAEEIRDGVLAVLTHVPNHLAAASHLAGWPIRDVFNVGLKLDE